MPIAPAVSPPPGPTRRITREEVVRLGQSARPWDFLPLAMGAVKAAPADSGIRFLLAANLAKLGLVTAAREQLAALAELGIPPGDPNVTALTQAMAALPEDRLPANRPLETCRWNLEVLAARGLDLEPEYERWAIGQAGCEWFRTLDGNLVRRRGEVWLGLGNHKAAAAAFAEKQFAAPEPQEVYTIEGIDPPWLLVEVAGRTPPTRLGFHPMLCIVQADAQEFLDGLAHADLAGVLREERAHFFVGPAASDRFAAHLRSRLETRIIGSYIPLPSTRRRAEPSPQDLIVSAQEEQSTEHQRLAAAVGAIYSPRDRAWWARRYADALAEGSPEPLRVLIPTTRHSSFLQHSSDDLAAVFRGAGCKVELLREPDAHAQHSSLAYLRAIDRFRPDLVVLINCFRASLGDWFPRLPYVCWIQDAMAHQFSPEAAAARTNLDFMVGHLHPEFFSHLGFTRDRTMAAPVVASESKFHPAPAGPALRGRFECEIAFVSHHGESPERLHLWLFAEARADRSAARVMEQLYPRVGQIAIDALGGDQVLRLQAATRSAIEAEIGHAAAPLTVTRFLHQYALPLAERILRHQTLHWSADIADRRGWRLRIFGKGWDAHERFAAYAGPPVEHGEELRACYQAAAAQLHISITALVHQRIMECALSGGLPLARLNSSALDTVTAATRRDLWLKHKPELYDAATGRHGFIVADCPDLMRLTALRQRLGLPHDSVFWSNPMDPDKLARTGPTPLESRPDWAFGDLAQVTFRTPEELESLLERAIESPAWRSGASEMIAGRVRRRLTHSAFVRSVLGLVRRSLDG